MHGLAWESGATVGAIEVKVMVGYGANRSTDRVHLLAGVVALKD